MANNDQCVTVRLPTGVRDKVVAATGQPFSRIVRYMCLELLKAKEREAGGATPQEVMQQDVASIAKNL